MNPQTEKMLNLQEVDLKIRTLKSRLQTIPIELEKIAAEIKENSEKFQKQKEELLTEELGIKKLEATIKDKEDVVKKLQSQSVMIRKNDEYKALMNEIENVKKTIGDFETDQLVLMDKIQKNKILIKDLEHKLNERKKSSEEEKKELLEIETKIKNEMDKNLQLRDGLFAGIDPENLRNYERLLSRGTGIPVAEVVDGECTNCHLKLTPHTVNQARKNTITHCDNCSHMIYIKE